MVTPLFKDGNSLSDLAIEDRKMFDSNHVLLNILADDNLDDETAATMLRLLRELYDKVQALFSFRYSDS